MSIAAPPIDPDPPNPIRPTWRTVTDTFLTDRSAYVVDAGRPNAGNGASVDLLVGLPGRRQPGPRARPVRPGVAREGRQGHQREAPAAGRTDDVLGVRAARPSIQRSPGRRLAGAREPTRPAARSPRATRSSARARASRRPARSRRRRTRARATLCEVDVTGDRPGLGGGSPNYGVRLARRVGRARARTALSGTARRRRGRPAPARRHVRIRGAVRCRNTAITLPQAGDEVTAAWGQAVAKALNGIQSGAANVTWAASSISGVTQVTFPRAYAVAPNVVRRDPATRTTASACCRSRRPAASSGPTDGRHQPVRVRGHAVGCRRDTGLSWWTRTGGCATCSASRSSS